MDIEFREAMLNGIKTGSAPGEVLEKYKNMGMDKERMYNVLEVLRQEMRETGDEASEDLIMDLMDRVVGWCSPDSRLFPDALEA